MQIVINIPKNTYKQIQALVRNDYFDHDICGNSMRRIAKGIPLSKGHGCLIDADKLQDYFGDNRSKLFQSKDCIFVINNAPTIIEADEAENE